jgi:hypothetical protein
MRAERAPSATATRTLFQSGVIACLVCLFCCSCSIFSPRPVQYPTSTTVDDPFNFASILWNTGKKFTKLEYIDLFADDCSYIDVDGNMFSKQDIKKHLSTIQSQITVNSATWKKDTVNPDIFLSDTMIIVNRIYDISIENQSGQSYDFADKASFRILFNSTKNAWTIAEWKDSYPGYSVFHPLYTIN